VRSLAVLVAIAACALVAAGCGNLVAAGQNLTCVVLPDGAPDCFGNNADGQAGHSAGTSPAAPGAVQLPKGYGVADIDAGMGDPDGDATVCAATAKTGGTNVVRCWGDDDHGQLGRGTAGAPSAKPVAVDLGGGSSDTVGVGAFSACALTDAVYCWGDNTHGQLGAATPGIKGPAPVPGTSKYRSSDGQDSTPVMLAVGELHVCAGIASSITCWGQGTSGQLGNGASADSATPVKLRLPAKGDTVGVISAGGGFTCATISPADLGGDADWCWGANEAGQLGNGTTAASNVPVRVALPEGTDPNRLSVGHAHACTVDSAGAVWCWGANGQGQLGNGTTAASATPVRVPGVKATLVAAGAIARGEPVAIERQPMAEADAIAHALAEASRAIDARQSALTASEARLRYIADATPAMLWTATPDGRIWASERWRAYTGLDRTATLRGFAAALHPEDRDRVRAQWREALRTGTDFASEARVRRHDGAWRWFQTHAIAERDGAGHVVAWYGSTSDVDDPGCVKSRPLSPPRHGNPRKRGTLRRLNRGGANGGFRRRGRPGAAVVVAGKPR